MPDNHLKECPRCKGKFECRAGDISECQCNGILLTPDERETIAMEYTDCLCIKCLFELRESKPSVNNQ